MPHVLALGLWDLLEVADGQLGEAGAQSSRDEEVAFQEVAA